MKKPILSDEYIASVMPSGMTKEQSDYFADGLATACYFYEKLIEEGALVDVREMSQVKPKKTLVFDWLDNVIGNYADGSATAEHVVRVAKEVNDYLHEHPHPHDEMKDIEFT